MSTFLGLWFLLANVVIIVLTSAILAGGFVPRRVVRRLQRQIDSQHEVIRWLDGRLADSERRASSMARLLIDVTPMPKVPEPQDAPTEEWVGHGRS